MNHFGFLRNDLDVDRCTVREKNQPLCMEQYGRVFTTYRRPAIPRDKQISTIKQPTDNQHIIVLCKNHVSSVFFFMVPNKYN